MSVSPSLLFVDQDYQINRSVRLRSAASAYFNKAISVTGSVTTYTLSCWVKRGIFASDQALISSRNNSGNGVTYLYFDTSDRLHFFDRNSSLTVQGEYYTNAVFRDPSAWYHIVCVVNTTQATSANRFSIYVNGVQQTLTTSTTFAQNTTTLLNSSGQAEFVGSMNPTYGSFFDGYLAEYNFIDGQALTPSSFGFTDINGIWQPKPYSSTYGTNGFYLKFTDNSAATAAAIGKDFSGNGNNWTPNNISITADVTYDSMLDSPTNSAGASNYCVLNPLNPSTTGLSNGNLTNTNAAASYLNALSTFGVSSGFNKLYAEFTITSATSLSSAIEVGVVNAIVTGRFATSSGSFTGVNLLATGNASSALYGNGSTLATGLTAASAGEVFQVAVDPSTLKCWIGRGNVWYDSAGGTTGNPSSGTNQTATLSGSVFYIGCSSYANTVNANFGQRSFTYTPPTGFLALNTYNLAASIVPNGAVYMAATTYTGTGAALSVTNSGNNAAAKSFQPDLVWTKDRSSAVNNHALYDSVRGTTRWLGSNVTDVEVTNALFLSAFNTNGFSLGGTSAVSNAISDSYIAWQWRAGGTSVLNGEGSIFSTVSVNRTAGFSVVTYTGTGANTTVGHGLGVAPKMVIVKSRTVAASNWAVWQSALAGTEYLLLNTTDAKATLATAWNSTVPTSTVFSIGTDAGVNSNAAAQVAYCWSEVAGYSKFGSYTGNGSTDGPFVYCGFRPRWVMVKYYGGTAVVDGPWVILDTSRDTYNIAGNQLLANGTGAESSAATVDLLSNGFKFRGLYQSYNSSGTTYIFAAFAENPFNTSRAR